MTTEQKIAKKGYSLRSNLGYKNGVQAIVSFSAYKNGREQARATSKTALLKKL